jgi:hypothetical protein
MTDTGNVSEVVDDVDLHPVREGVDQTGDDPEQLGAELVDARGAGRGAEVPHGEPANPVVLRGVEVDEGGCAALVRLAGSSVRAQPRVMHQRSDRSIRADDDGAVLLGGDRCSAELRVERVGVGAVPVVEDLREDAALSRGRSVGHGGLLLTWLRPAAGRRVAG